MNRTRFFSLATVLAVITVACGMPVTSAFGLILNCPQRYQESNKWCWAGTSQSVLYYWGANVTQSNIAQFGTGGLNTPNFTWGDGVNKEGVYCKGVDLILTNFAAVYSTHPGYALSVPELRNQIETNRRPVVMHWAWDTGDGHILAVHGIVVSNRYSPKFTNVWVMDPQYGPTVGSYDWVCRGNTNSEGWHTWDLSLVFSTPAPDPAVSPAGLDFGRVEIGTTVTQMCALDNDGGGWAVGTITAGAPFGVVNGSPYSVRSSTGIPVYISYSPTALGTNTATILFTNTTMFQIGESPGTTCTATGIGSLLLEEALDTPYLTFAPVASSAPFWKLETGATHDGVDAAGAGPLPSDGTAIAFTTTVTGPGTVSFWRKVTGSGIFFFLVGGVSQTAMDTQDWNQYAATVPAGSQTLEWMFYRDIGDPSGGIGYVDQVTYAPAVVVGWGTNDYGQLNVPAGLTNIVGLAGSWQGSYALKSDLIITGWGSAYTNYGGPPAGLTNVVAIATPVAMEGGDVLALQGDGRVVAWGDNSYHQTNVPAGLTNTVAVAAGSRHSLALKGDGTVAAWGDDIFHQTNVPPNLTNVVAIAAGQYHNVALNQDGTVTAWGYNVYHQTNVPAGLSNAVAVAAGSDHSMALRADGTVLVWGNNIGGETNVPPGLSNVVAIAAGAYHCLALKADGNVVAWGANDSSQTNVPTWLNHAVAIVAGANHNLALMSGEPSAGTLCLTNVTLLTNRFTVRVPTIRGRGCYLEYKDSLMDARWTMRPPVPGDGTIRQLTDPLATTGQRFYRVRQQ